MFGRCKHEFVPLTTVILFNSRQAVLEQCARCDKLSARYLPAVVEEAS